MPHKVVVLHPDKPTYAFKNRVTIPFQPLVLYLQGSCLVRPLLCFP